jgi:hypothetical protein
MLMMAKPIKETPVLKGDDARRFIDNMNAFESKRIDSSVRKRIKSNYDKLNAISQF